jgi:hypothetical protein
VAPTSADYVFTPAGTDAAIPIGGTLVPGTSLDDAVADPGRSVGSKSSVAL